MSNSSTKKVGNSVPTLTLKLNSGTKENMALEIPIGKIKKKMNISYIPDDKYISKTSRERNGSPKLLSARSEMTSCTTRRARENDNEGLPYFCLVSQSK
jgi:hypothetical protein